MELHFCSQCGISIPLAEVQSGAAKVSDGRFACSEHREGAGPLSKAAQAAGGAGSPGSEFELLFCANCQVSIPAADLQNGRAKREFGSLFCPMCSLADTAERERRKKVVEAAMAADATSPPSLPPDTAETRRCGVCSAPVPQTQIDAGRAVVDGDRVVCPRCRDAGAVARTRPAPTVAGARGSSPYLVGALVVACLAAGFFGALYFKEYVRTQQAPTVAPAGQREVADLRAAMAADLDTLRSVIAQRADEQRDATKEAIDLSSARIADDLAGLRGDLTEIQSRLVATDGDLAQRVARLEGQIGGISEMVKGLAARPSGGDGSHTGPTVPPGGGEVKPPPGPPAGDPPVAPGPPPVAQPDPVVTKLIKDMLESNDAGVRFTAACELIRRKERVAIPGFAKALIDDTNVMVRRAAARGLGELKAWNGVPALIQALEDKEAYVAQQANFALQSITGQDFGVSIDHSIRDRKVKAAAAMRWWEKNKDNPLDGVCLEPVTAKP